VSYGSYFFARMNRIGSVVELKFYIRVQEEDIRMQEEFVYTSCVSWIHGPRVEPKRFDCFFLHLLTVFLYLH